MKENSGYPLIYIGAYLVVSNGLRTESDEHRIESTAIGKIYPKHYFDKVQESLEFEAPSSIKGQNHTIWIPNEYSGTDPNINLDTGKYLSVEKLSDADEVITHDREDFYNYLFSFNRRFSNLLTSFEQEGIQYRVVIGTLAIPN